MMSDVYEAMIHGETKVLTACPSKYLKKFEDQLQCMGFQIKR